jgi:hypothetical protein
LEKAEKPGLFIDLTAFEGYESLAALREDAKLDTSHANDFSRIAVIGDRKWTEWGTGFADVLTGADMQWFDTSNAAEAKEWAQKA